MEKKTHISYDRKEDILSLLNSENISNSIRIDNVIIDLDNKSNIVGIEIFNATRFFSSSNISKKFLSNLKKAKLSIHGGKNWASMLIVLYSKIAEHPVEKELAIPSIAAQNHAVVA